MIPYQFDPVSSWAQQNPLHLKIYDPALIPVLLAFVHEKNLYCEETQTNKKFTEYTVRCNEDELNRLDTHLRLHSSSKG